jgi:hypothetical protein
MVMRPLFSKRSRPVKRVFSLAAESAVRSVPPAWLRKRSEPLLNRLVPLALNSPPDMFVNVSLLSVRSTKPVISPELLMDELAPIVPSLLTLMLLLGP